MSSSEREQLASCPFCGDVPTTIEADETQGYKWGRVRCCIQGPEVRTGYDTSSNAAWHAEAIAAWNRRATAGTGEPVARMEVLNPGAVTYCVTAAARRLPPGDYLLYAAPKQAPLTDEQRKDLLAAALYVTAHDDASAVLQQDDAERIADLLLDLSGFELPGCGITAAKESNLGAVAREGEK